MSRLCAECQALQPQLTTCQSPAMCRVLTQKEPTDMSIEELAAIRIEELRAKYPDDVVMGLALADTTNNVRTALMDETYLTGIDGLVQHATEEATASDLGVQSETLHRAVAEMKILMCAGASLRALHGLPAQDAQEKQLRKMIGNEEAETPEGAAEKVRAGWPDKSPWDEAVFRADDDMDGTEPALVCIEGHDHCDGIDLTRGDADTLISAEELRGMIAPQGPTMLGVGPIPAQRIADLMITAIEGGIDYWATVVEVSRYGVCEPYAEPESYAGVSWAVHGADTVTGERWGFSATEFAERIGKRLWDQNQHVTDWLAGNEDAETADVLVQIAAFDEIRFG